MKVRRINVTLGTAGHIDHGKTALIRLLTGCETDRLKVEKERGMSIELGFAPCTVGGLGIGIVDVPGHENFVRTMVSGATSIDGVILVVAADDGVMPQTREHLDIITLLGVTHGIIALTKIDRVEPEHLRTIHRQIEKFLAGTFLENAPILPVSNVTGEGFGAFTDALKSLVDAIEPKETEGIFRLPVERRFSIKGYGTVISGIPVSGTIGTGDEVVLLPHNLTGRIAAIQAYKRNSDMAQSGQCAALNIRHWDPKIIHRGDTLTVPGFFKPSRWFACRLRLLNHPGLFLKNGSRARLHTGTSEVNTSVYLMNSDAMGAGIEELAQLKLDKPIVAGPGDRFILRNLSPAATIGGGMIIEALQRRLKRRRSGIVADLQSRSQAVLDASDFVEYCLRTAPKLAANTDELARRTKNPAARVTKLLEELIEAQKVVRLTGELVMHSLSVEQTENRLGEILTVFHKRSPQSPGMTFDELREAAGGVVAKPVLEALIDRLVGRGKLVCKGTRLALTEHTETFTDRQSKAMQTVENLFRKQAFNPPDVAEMSELAKLNAKETDAAVKTLLEQEKLVRVSPKLLFHCEAVGRAREILIDFITREGRLESVKFKYLLETTRKFAIPLLDYFDNVGVTIRTGNTRHLKKSI